MDNQPICEVLEKEDRCDKPGLLTYYNNGEVHKICTQHYQRSSTNTDTFTLTKALFVQDEE